MESNQLQVTPPFFRYHRLNSDSPKGGVVVLAQLHHDKGLLVFSASVCSQDDNFDRAEGRRIFEERWGALQTFTVTGYSEKICIRENIKFALMSYLFPTLPLATDLVIQPRNYEALLPLVTPLAKQFIPAEYPRHIGKEASHYHHDLSRSRQG